MIVNSGYNLFASTIASKITHGEVGVDNTTPTETDTDLIAPTSGTLALVDQSVASGQSINVIYTLDVNRGNGYSIKEFALKNVDTETTLISRYIFPAINKNSNLEISFKTNYLIE